MRKHVEESVATGAAAGRGRGGRFSAGRKREVVLRLLRGEDLESVSRAVGITAARASHSASSVSGCGAGGPKEPRDGCPGRRPSSAAGQDRRAADGDRVAVCEGGPAGPAALWPGGGRRDEWRPVDLHPSGVWRAAGLPRVALRPLQACMRGVRRPRPRRRVVAAVRSAPPRMTSWWPTFVGCSKPRRFMARATEKCGRSCGLRGGAPRRSGCGG